MKSEITRMKETAREILTTYIAESTHYLNLVQIVLACGIAAVLFTVGTVPLLIVSIILLLSSHGIIYLIRKNMVKSLLPEAERTALITLQKMFSDISKARQEDLKTKLTIYSKDEITAIKATINLHHKFLNAIELELKNYANPSPT